MFPSTLLKVSLCAILASVVGVNAQSAANVTCDNLPLAPLNDCQRVVDVLRVIRLFLPNDDGQANFTVASCMARVLFDPSAPGIGAPDFAENLQPILDTCRINDPMSGEIEKVAPNNGYQLFLDPTLSQ